MELHEAEIYLIKRMESDPIFRLKILEVIIESQQQEIADLEYALKEKTSWA